MEPITSVLDAFIKLADRIINLEKTKLQHRQILFNEIVKPVFEELEPVASNYIDVFRKAKNAMNTDSIHELKQSIEFVEHESFAMFVARAKVEQMVIQIREHIKDEDVNKFAVAVFFFFYNTEKIDTPSRTRVFLTLLRRMEAKAESIGEIPIEDKSFLSDFISESLTTLEQYWNEIVQAFERLNIYSVTPSKFIRKRLTKRTKPQ